MKYKIAIWLVKLAHRVAPDMPFAVNCSVVGTIPDEYAKEMGLDYRVQRDVGAFLSNVFVDHVTPEDLERSNHKGATSSGEFLTSWKRTDAAPKRERLS